MKIGNLYGMSVEMTKDGDVIISAHGQPVLKIVEVSDIDTINLFLTPILATILPCELVEPDNPVKFELLANRNKQSKIEFEKHEPQFTITKEDSN